MNLTSVFFLAVIHVCVWIVSSEDVYPKEARAAGKGRIERHIRFIPKFAHGYGKRAQQTLPVGNEEPFVHQKNPEYPNFRSENIKVPYVYGVPKTTEQLLYAILRRYKQNKAQEANLEDRYPTEDLATDDGEGSRSSDSNYDWLDEKDLVLYR